MTTVHRLATAPDGRLPFKGTQHVAFTKGAADGLLARATRCGTGEQPEPLGDALQARIRGGGRRAGTAGMRVLGIACRLLETPGASADADLLERDLTFLDFRPDGPPRAAVRPRWTPAEAAGIRPVMITGDIRSRRRHRARPRHWRRPEAVTGAASAAWPSSWPDRREVSGLMRGCRPDKLPSWTLEAARPGGGHDRRRRHDAPALKKKRHRGRHGYHGTDVAKEPAGHGAASMTTSATIVAAVEGGA